MKNTGVSSRSWNISTPGLAAFQGKDTCSERLTLEIHVGVAQRGDHAHGWR